MTQEDKRSNLNRVFYFFDKEIADSISKKGRTLIREIYLKKKIMTQEDKELLLKDLCARLPYGVKVEYNSVACEVLSIDKYNEELTIRICPGYTPDVYLVDVKPFLFPLSSMTEEHREELYKIGWYLDGDKIYSCFRNYDDENYKTHTNCFELINWCYKNNFDINGLIPKGLAIDATGLNVY